MTTTRKIRLGEQTQGQIPSDQLADGTDTAGNVPVANGDGTQTWAAATGGAPDAHAASHENGGSDEIDATGLTGAGSATHEADATDAHDASAISFDDTGLGITAADVQEMGEQLDAAISAGGIPATIVDAAGDLIVASAADTAVRLPMGSALQTLRVNAGATALEYAAASGGISSGTSFPGSPANNDIFYRTDLDLIFFFDGTRWLTTTLYTDAITPVVALPLAATTTANRMALPLAGVMGVWVEDFYVSFFVNSGGTALGASHKWVCTLVHNPGPTTIGTVNIDSGAASAWRNSGAVAVDTALATTQFEIEVASTKTGTPGSIFVLPRVVHRLIGT